MPEPNSATKPKRRSPVTSTANVRVELTKVVSDEHFRLSRPQQNESSVLVRSLKEKFILSEDGDVLNLTNAQATSMLACIKAFFSGRGTGTPRKKK